MVCVNAIINGATICVARGDPIMGYQYNGMRCPIEFVFQELEQSGYMYFINVPFLAKEDHSLQKTQNVIHREVLEHQRQ
jgi:hypothetical protein